MNKRYKPDSVELKRLRDEVENFLESPLCVPDDFVKASVYIRNVTGEYISNTTLMRIWGYVRDAGENYTPSVFSLRVLCNLVGFKNMEDFLGSSSVVQSKEYTGQFIQSINLPTGSDIELSWSPNRRVILRHISSSLFEVIKSENSRLRREDRVDCGCFMRNAPAYFSRVFRAGVEPFTYVAGSAFGVNYRVLSGDRS